MTAVSERPDRVTSPYLEGPFAPIDTEITADCEVIGELPDDLAGVFVRNGANPKYEPPGRYHWFDGDGMLHAMQFENGHAVYRNRYVATEALAIESDADHAIWSGINERPDFSHPGGPFKDTANTDLVFHDGRLLALWWLGGPCYEVALPSLETVGRFDFHGTLPALTAHPKLDPVTGELMTFDYGLLPPYLTYGVVDAGGRLVHHTEVDLPGPRLLHDLAITDRHTILMDFPLMWDPELLAQGRTRVTFRPDLPARFGVIGRHAAGDTVRWFESESCYMYHAINAWETDTEIVIVGCRIDDPLREDGRPGVPHIDVLRLEPYLHEWRLDLVSGTVRERPLDDVMTEFPRMDNRRLGRASQYAYSPRIAPASEVLFDGFVKYDTRTGVGEHHEYGEGRFGSETVFAPRVGATDADDDGYVLAFVADATTGDSEVVVVDARRAGDEPVCRVRIPQRVPIGYHSWWVPAAEITAG